MFALSLCLTTSFISMALGAPVISNDASGWNRTADDILSSVVKFWTRQEPVPAAGTTLDTPAIIGIVAGVVGIIFLVLLLFLCGRANRYPSPRVLGKYGMPPHRQGR
ncbi:hypothetical protein F4805DRAFT_460018 [Annulohypoxylon moriforme]|nr:hypothetical protein F4805DRAFT_460018 [Annulohypoxylon moriforme]